MKIDILNRITGQDASFYQSVVTRIIGDKDPNRVNAGFLAWAARKEMEDIYTAKHVQVILEVEDTFVFGEYDEDLNPVPTTMVRIRFYDPRFCKFYREWITLLNLTQADYAALNITPTPGTFKL